jgi:hypothetical protein
LQADSGKFLAAQEGLSSKMLKVSAKSRKLFVCCALACQVGRFSTSFSTYLLNIFYRVDKTASWPDLIHPAEATTGDIERNAARVDL